MGRPNRDSYQSDDGSGPGIPGSPESVGAHTTTHPQDHMPPYSAGEAILCNRAYSRNHTWAWGQGMTTRSVSTLASPVEKGRGPCRPP